MANEFKYDIFTVDIDNPAIFEYTQSSDDKPKRRINKLNGNIRYWKDGSGEQRVFPKWAKFKNSKRIKHIIIPKNYSAYTVQF